MVPGFSSTTGIQIAMSQFNKTSYNKNEETLDIGAGCLWDEVYRAADEERRRIVGGATSEGVGVAGYLLGGGYSLKTNQFGLGCDNITKIRIILTDGKIVECSPRDQNYRDLFYGLLVRTRLLRSRVRALTLMQGRRQQFWDCHSIHH